MAATEEKLTVQAILDRPNSPLVLLGAVAQVFFQFACGEIPEADGFVVAATDQGLSVGAEGDRPNPSSMAREDLKTGSGFDVPDPDAVIKVAAG